MTGLRFDPIDAIGGAIVLVVGLIASGISLTYPMGSSAAIGPGVFPLILGVVMSLIGVAMLGGSLNRDGTLHAMNMRATMAVFGALAVFALLIRPFGLVPAACACVVVGRLAEPDMRLLPVGVLAIALAALCWLIFVVALGLPLPVLRWPL